MFKLLNILMELVIGLEIVWKIVGNFLEIFWKFVGNFYVDIGVTLSLNNWEVLKRVVPLHISDPVLLSGQCTNIIEVIFSRSC